MTMALSDAAREKIEGFRTAMGLPSAGQSGGGGGAGGDGGGEAPAAAAPASTGDPAADKIAAIKARIAAAKAGGGGAAPAAAPAGAATATAAAPAGDMAGRIAALKAKMEAGKGDAKAKPARKPVARPSSKNIWPVQPIDRTSFGDDFLYKPNTLNKWFILTSVLLTVTCLLMWQRDWVRDWKHWQRLKQTNDKEMIAADIVAADAAIDAGALEAANAAIERAEADLAGQQAQLDTLEADLATLQGKHYAANQAYQFAKSEFDSLRYIFEQKRLAHGGDADVLADTEEVLEGKRTELMANLLLADEASEAMESKKVEIETLSAGLVNAERAKDDLLSEKTQLEARLEKLAPSNVVYAAFNDYVRDAPMLDMLQPTLKIDQIVLEDLKDNYNFMFVGKIDRCTTCHASIADTAYIDHDPRNENKQMVLNAHPRLDLYVADGSPHPAAEFGCTVCHQGRGQAVEFPRTFHMPAADEWEGGRSLEEKTEDWVNDYGYDPKRHYWDWPMVPQDKIFSSCFQCHEDTARLPGIPEYNASRELVEDYGCYGCHKIEGFEDYRKVGPDLTNLVAKTDADWVAKWIMDPQGFRPSTRMPHFWNQSNRGGGDVDLARNGYDPDGPEWNNNSDRFVDDYRARNDVEAQALTAYLFHKSEGALDYSMKPVPNRKGDAANGEQLFEDRGCLACHAMESNDWNEADHGPDLSAIGSKTNPKWLFNWILDPKAYYPTSVMPDLRLSDDEAWDITAYLMGAEHDDWDDRPAPRQDDGLLDGIAVEYKSQLASVSLATKMVEQMRAAGGREEVELYVGEKLFQHYGCAGCHLVPGHYEDKGIGTELTKEGLKEVAKFDFGFEYSHDNPEAIPHTRHDWFRAKLQDTRIFDRMPVVEGHGHDAEILRFDMKVKAPADKLKMPNFYFEEWEVELIVQFLMGLREEGIADNMKHNLTGDALVAEQGARIMRDVNCVGCHRVGLTAGAAYLDEDVIEEGYEYDLWAAGDIEVAGQTLWEAHDWVTDEVYEAEEEEDLVETLDYLEEKEFDGLVQLYGLGEGVLGRYLEDKALRPPTLRGEGDKVQAPWLYSFLMEPFTVRNHVKARMPTFGFTREEAEAVTQWFSIRDGENWPFETDPVALDEELLAEGAALFEEYQCQSCHPQGDVLPSNPDQLNWGPDLGLAKERLEPSWIKAWLLDPAVISPGTKMPNFLGEYIGPEYESYVDDAEREADALVQYLIYMDQVAPKEISMATPDETPEPGEGN